MGAGKSSAAQPLLPAGANREAVQQYLTYLYDHHPGKFEQYFTSLFLSPTSPMFADRNSFYQFYAAYLQLRQTLSTELTSETTRVPDNAAALKKVHAGIQRILNAFQQLMQFDQKLNLLFTLNAMFPKYEAIIQQRHGQDVPADLMVSVQKVQFMFQAVNLAGALVPFVTAIGNVLNKLYGYTAAFATIKQSGFTDEKAVRTLWQTAQLSPLDRSLIVGIPPPYNTLVALETQLSNYLDAMINEWRKFSDLPFAPPNENITLYLGVLKHLYDTSLARGNVMSQAMSYELVKQMQTKMLNFFDTGAFEPRTAVVYLSTHGGLKLKTDPQESGIFVEKKMVPADVVITRVTFAPPGAVVHANESELHRFVELIQTVMKKSPDAVNRPMNFVFSLMDHLHEERKAQGLEPDKFMEEDDETIKSGDFNVDYEFYSDSFMRPEAVMYLPREKYLDKQYFITPEEKKEGYRTIELLTATTRTSLLKKTSITLNNLVKQLTSPPLDYNNLIFIDQTSNVFSSETESFNFQLIHETSQKLVKQGLLGSGRKTI